MARNGKEYSQEPEVPSRCPMWEVGVHILGQGARTSLEPSSAAFPGLLAGAGLEVESKNSNCHSNRMLASQAVA